MKKRMIALSTAVMLLISILAIMPSNVGIASPGDPDPEKLTAKITLDSGNYIPNGGFESAIGTSPGWWTNGSLANIVTTDSIEGNSSVRVVPSGEWQGCVGGTPVIPVLKKGEVYKYTACFKILNLNTVGNEDEDQVQIGFLGTAANIVVNKRNYGSYGSNWVRVTKYLDAEELRSGAQGFQLHGNKGKTSSQPIELLVDAVGLYVVNENSIDEVIEPVDNPYDKDYANAKKIDVKLDKSIKSQTLEGMGFFGTMGNMGNGKFYTDAWIDKMIDDLGLSMLRLEMSPNELVSSESELDKKIEYVKALMNKAKAKDQSLKIILTVWSPPAKFKTNNSEINGGNLRESDYANYAQWCIDVLKEYQKNGIKIYALSLQNEPNFVEPYNSCVYTPQTYANLLKQAVPLIKKEFTDIKIFGSENMLGFEGNVSHGNPNQLYHKVIRNDSEALKNIDAFASHGYVDGVAAEKIENHKKYWEYSYNTYVKGTGKTNWMSETSGYNDDWNLTDQPDALDYAAAIGSALKYGKASAWVHWTGSEINMQNRSLYSIMDGMKSANKYAVSKHYYRFIRPGDVMIDSQSSDETVLSTSFIDQNDKHTTVLVNGEDKDKIVTLSGLSELSNLQYYVSTAAKGNNCAYIGEVQGNNIRLPAYGVVTITTKDITKGDIEITPTPAPTTSPDAGIVVEENFEGTPPAPLTNFLEGWNGSTFSLETPGMDGTGHAAKLSGAVWQSGIIKLSGSLVAGKRYEVTFWVKGAFYYARLADRNNSNGSVGEGDMKEPSFPMLADWTKKTFYVDCKVTTNAIGFVSQMPDKEVLFDNITIKAAP